MFTMRHLKAMNSLCALASIGVKESRVPGYNPTYKIEGVMHHRIGSVRPRPGHKPKYMQVYFVHPGDPARELADRLAQFARPHVLQPDVQAQHQSAEVPRIVPEEEEVQGPEIQELPLPQQIMRASALEANRKFQEYLKTFQDLLHRVNPYLAFVKAAMDLPTERDIGIVLNHSKEKRAVGVHERNWNFPTADEVLATSLSIRAGTLWCT